MNLKEDRYRYTADRQTDRKVPMKDMHKESVREKKEQEIEKNYETDQRAGRIIKPPLDALLLPTVMKSISYQIGGGERTRPLLGVSVQYAKVHTLVHPARDTNPPTTPYNPPTTHYIPHFFMKYTADTNAYKRTRTHAQTQTPAR